LTHPIPVGALLPSGGPVNRIIGKRAHRPMHRRRGTPPPAPRKPQP
jgi:hypothetical protein